MKPIAIFYHCLFYLGDPPELMPLALQVVKRQMDAGLNSGLIPAASEFIVGINGGVESRELSNLFIPAKAKRVMHGLQSKAENLTIVEIEKWAKDHPGWNVLYFHSKGATHTEEPPDGLRAKWRNCMMRNLIDQWKRCVLDLDSGFDSVGCHWMPGMVNGTQNIWAGNFWWARSEFLSTLPSIYERDRIKVSGIDALESRYEAEVWIGNGPRLPVVKDYHPGGFRECP